MWRRAFGTTRDPAASAPVPARVDTWDEAAGHDNPTSGTYEAAIVSYELMPEIAMYNRASKLRIDFDLVRPDGTRVILPFYCNVRLIRDRTRSVAPCGRYVTASGRC